MKIFISCSSLDKEIAYRYKEKFKKLSVDVSTGASIKPGEKFLDALRRELDSADLIVILLTNNYVSSSWTQLEMNTVLLAQKHTPFYVIIERGVILPNYFSNFSNTIVNSIENPDDFLFDRIKELPAICATIDKIDIDTPLTRLNKQLSEKNITIVIGAGASIDAGLPSWNTLISKSFSQYMNDLSSNELINALPSSNLIRAKYLKTGLGEKFTETINEILYSDVKHERAILKAIAKLISRTPTVEAVITFNYDSLLEEELKKEGIKFCSLCDKIHRDDCDLPIYHVHGFLPLGDYSTQASDKIVFSEDEYHTQYIEPHGWSNTIQLYHYMNNVCLFIGTSLTDPNLRRLLDSAKRTKPSNISPTHYVIKTKQSKSSLQKKLMDLEEKDLQTLGINMIWVDSHSEESTIINEL